MQLKVNKQPISLKITLISLILLIGQYAALAHSVEHPFHEASQACEVYLALEHSKGGLLTDDGAILSLVIHSHSQIQSARVGFANTRLLFSIRAPPSV